MFFKKFISIYILLYQWVIEIYLNLCAFRLPSGYRGNVLSEIQHRDAEMSQMLKRVTKHIDKIIWRI